MSTPARTHPSASASATFEPLLELATPQLYEQIAFRLLELPVHASERELERRRELMEKAARSALPVPAGAGRILPPQSPADEHALRAASHALQDAQQRLAHEFFWFWPLPPATAAADPALRHLVAGDATAAREAWRKAQGEAAAVAAHNLAVWHHLRALEGEASLLAGPPSNEDSAAADLDAEWKAAHALWRKVLADDVFWARVGERIRQIDDARLPASAAHGLRETLPVVLALSLARLVARAMDSGHVAQAQRLGRRLTEAGFDEAALEQARRIATLPVRSLCKALRQEANERARADKPHADAAAEWLLERAAGPLAVLDLLLPPTHPARQAERDELADAALGCVIDFHNETLRARRSLALIDRIVPLACGSAVQQRIEKNHSNVAELLEDTTCWFCNCNDADQKHGVEVKLFGDVKHEPVEGGTRTTWRHGTYTVPRCGECVAEEQLLSLSGRLALLVSTLGLGAAVLLFQRSEVWGLAAGAVTVFVSTWMAVRDRAAKQRRCRPEIKRRARDDFPPVKERRAEGWLFGDRPVGA